MSAISDNQAGSAANSAVLDSNTPSTHPFTCNTCQVAFRTTDLQRTHMRSPWHRYNLKRRVISLPPVSAEAFNDKVVQNQADQDAAAGKATFERRCDACQKSFGSQNSYENHVLSQKHKANIEAVARRSPRKVEDEASSIMSSTFSLGEPVSKEAELDSDAEEEFDKVIKGLQKTDLNGQGRPSPVNRPSNPEPTAAHGQINHPISRGVDSRSSTASPSVKTQQDGVPTLNTCIFCNYLSPTPKLNIIHMERIHGLFVPEKDYLVDLEGLIGALQKTVFEYHECLDCHKAKGTTFAVQEHMKDKSHCKIPYTTLGDQMAIGDFYDFTSTYSDEETEDESMDDDDKQAGGAKLATTNGKGDEDGDVAMNDKGPDDEGWETDSSASSILSEDIGAVPAEGHYHQYERLGKHPHHSKEDPRLHHQVDGWHSHAHKHVHAAYHDEYELHLPTGKAVGHRAYARYYRQNLTNHPTPRERLEAFIAKRALEAAGSWQEVYGDSDDKDVMSDTNNTTENNEVATRAKGGELARLTDVPFRVVTTDADMKAIQKAERQEAKAVLRKSLKKDWKGREGNRYYPVCFGLFFQLRQED